MKHFYGELNTVVSKLVCFHFIELHSFLVEVADSEKHISLLFGYDLKPSNLN
jgi:hypothetical protein